MIKVLRNRLVPFGATLWPMMLDFKFSCVQFITLATSIVWPELRASFGSQHLSVAVAHVVHQLTGLASFKLGLELSDLVFFAAN